jgi:hypothetical protein
VTKSKFAIVISCLFFSLSAHAITFNGGKLHHNFKNRIVARVTPPVPEPSNLALMSVGIGMVAFSLIKKNKC